MRLDAEGKTTTKNIVCARRRAGGICNGNRNVTKRKSLVFFNGRRVRRTRMAEWPNTEKFMQNQ